MKILLTPLIARPPAPAAAWTIAPVAAAALAAALVALLERLT